ncbi:hypothetical protein BO79DRAFT_258308 [Aspergillus costaricaensis CBS 115574]|uniref:Uncharacterized protein n=1 Tax=Aspergillus costaricaensis CBS 115574 TaxID=1448317 RepID=A0ACD1I5L9_9EURO|nr:hypothetical protein BO79DRAFT_258308 [Aspergillus costaricaensis CBS 115574]RAK85571.1 hypothetical protein BO79DRAFT_258308 [Aspergillus costaricaensis CBS 115574]
MPFRWLCMHGGEMNSTMFKIQLAPLMVALQAEHDCEFVFLNATFPVEHSRVPDADCYPGGYFVWVPLSEDTNRDKLKQCHQYIRHNIDKRGPIDGIIAYSQGSSIVCDMLVREMVEKVDILGPLRCCVFFSGYCPPPVWGPDAGHDNAPARLSPKSLPDPIAVPSLHVLGSEDFTRSVALEMKELFEEDSARLLEFEGDHWIPSDLAWVMQIKNELKALMCYGE